MQFFSFNRSRSFSVYLGQHFEQYLVSFWLNKSENNWIPHAQHAHTSHSTKLLRRHIFLRTHREMISNISFRLSFFPDCTSENHQLLIFYLLFPHILMFMKDSIHCTAIKKKCINLSCHTRVCVRTKSEISFPIARIYISYTVLLRFVIHVTCIFFSWSSFYSTSMILVASCSKRLFAQNNLNLNDIFTTLVRYVQCSSVFRGCYGLPPLLQLESRQSAISFPAIRIMYLSNILYI